MVSIPRACASCGFAIVTGCPFTRISPASGGRAPDSVRMSVVFPAPLPPTRPMHSPGYTSTETPFTARTPPNETRMSRMSTSRTRCAAAGASTDPVTAMPSSPPAAHECVEPDCGHENEADDDVLRRRIDEQQHHARAQRLHHDGAEDSARYRANTARERGPADDRGRDDVELVLHAEVGDRGVEARRLHRGADRGKRAHEREREHDRSTHVDTCEGRGVGVAADRVAVATEARPRREERHDERDEQQEDDGKGD